MILRQALVLSLILSTIAAVVGYIFAPQLIQFMGSTEEATLIGGTQYLRIQMIGIPAVALTSVVTATMRGIGNSRIAMIYNIIAMWSTSSSTTCSLAATWASPPGGCRRFAGHHPGPVCGLRHRCVYDSAA